MRLMKIGILFFLSAVILFSEGFLNATAAQNNRIPAGWEKYDFIPGYQLIFYDDFSNDRLNEKPQAWKLIEGNTEVILFDNLRWLRAINQSFVAPQLEILPAQFTLEMDFYVTPRGYSGNYRVDIYGQTDNDWAALTIEDLGAYFNTSWGLNLEYPLELQGRHRLSIALTNDGFKCYVDSLRVISTPKSASFRPRDFEIFMPGGEKAGDDKSAITNVRVAYLDKNFREQIQVNGKIVSYGMTFSNGAVNPKPEAFATLKELAALMQNDLNLNLSIECHVYELDDVSDNNRLSQQRAEALRETLITLYKVEGDRLRTKGWGSAKPLENDIVDSRAANPRVEFVKR